MIEHCGDICYIRVVMASRGGNKDEVLKGDTVVNRMLIWLYGRRLFCTLSRLGRFFPRLYVRYPHLSHITTPYR